MIPTLVLLLVLPLFGPSPEQALIRGTVTDASSGQPLSAATIQVDGTFVGTVANRDGAFEIEVADFPATLVVRFVGFRTERVVLNEAPSAALRITMEPQPIQLSGVVVSSEDPAVGIMRRVIAKKQKMRQELERFSASAYNRFTVANDTGIVSIAEGLSEFYWDYERGSREVVTASRATENLDVGDMLPAALFIANLYDDNIDVAGHNLVGVTHPDAVDHYDFRLESTTEQDGREVYLISVRTWNRLATGFEGEIAVADGADVLLTVDLRPNDAFIFPPPIQFFDVAYKQQYLPYGDDQWLPADFRAELDLKVGFRGLLNFPVFRIRQFSRLSDYQVNVALPDSLFEGDDIVSAADSAASVSADSLLDVPGVAVPLSELEEIAYASIDSTDTIEEAFAPGGALGRAARVSDGGDEATRRLGFLDLTPDVGYNRVEGVSPALKVEVGNDYSVHARVGHSFGLDQTFFGAGAELQLKDFTLSGGWDNRVRTTYDSWTRTRLENSVGFAFGRDDYFDYYESERIDISLAFDAPELWMPDVSVGLRREDVSALPLTTTKQLVTNRPVMPNPAVGSGRIASFVFGATVGQSDPFGIVSTSSADATVEVAQMGLLGSEHNFVRMQLRASGYVDTFFRRRLLPQNLGVHLVLGLSSGQLPHARMLSVDGSNATSRPGALRTLEHRPYEGDRAVFLGWEHHFRTLPFERLGWRWAVERGLGIIAFGGHGRTWLRDENTPGDPRSLFPADWAPNMPDAWHHEVGVSLNGVGGLFRVDFARRLDEPAWAIGIGVARLF